MAFQDEMEQALEAAGFAEDGQSEAGPAEVGSKAAEGKSKADSRRYGVLIISHGSRSPEWVRLVDEAVSQVKVPEGVPVECSFLEIVEGRLIQDGIDRLEAAGVTDIIAVPLFVSSGSTHVDEISWSLGVVPEPKLETDLPYMRRSARVHWTGPIDADPDIAALMWEKVRELSTVPSREVLLVVGHGSKEAGFHEAWQEVLRSLAEQIGRLGGFAAVDTAMLLPEQAGEKVRRWTAERPDWGVVVAPFFLSEGYFTETVIPGRLEGLDYRYNGRALLPDPLLARWMEKRIDAVLNGGADILAGS
ncbi:sirohydrochlorin chelatase [Paenibacillus gansuensis]|uniref:Sirohydrochlorin chelatase n=1 Tax=Paenibacillus gansuensis TaxID=306542 RepID=A0ABW5P7W7_9BACL